MTNPQSPDAGRGFGATVRQALIGIALAVLGTWLGPVAHALSATGYELAPTNFSIQIGDEDTNPRVVGPLAVNQVTHQLYVSIPTLDTDTGVSGEIQQREPDGTQSVKSPFTTGLNNTYFGGVAVDPTTQNIYTNQARITVTAGTFGEHRMRIYSPTGVQVGTFPLSNTTTQGSNVAVSSAGHVFYPSDLANNVQVYDSSGVLKTTFDCTGCPGGPFISPGRVALDASDNAYVIDVGNDRVIKFTHTGETYAYSSVLVSGREAQGLAIDTATGEIFVVGKKTGGYHVIVYNPAGTQLDDFGGGLLAPIPPQFASLGGLQMTVDVGLQKLYVADPGNFRILRFNRVTSTLPVVGTTAASSVGQLTATTNATVNPKGHAILDCVFEYVDHAEFLANGFDNAADGDCSSFPDGEAVKAVSRNLEGLSPDTTYHFRVKAESNAGISTGSALTFETLPATPPTVTTTSATKVTQVGATLVGKVNPHGGVTSNCRFEYGTSASYGKEITCASVPGPGVSEVELLKPVAALAPATTYHYRLVVTTNAGTQGGVDKEFTTLPFLPPTVTVSSASSVTQTGATLSGSVNPNGASTSCHFEYGTSTAYGSTAPCPVNPGDGASPVSQQLAFTSLSPSTTYHYRLVGSSTAGTVNSGDVSFTTSTPTVSPPPVVQPPPVVKKPPLTCKKGFKKKKVRGKLKCVKKKKRKAKRRRR